MNIHQKIALGYSVILLAAAALNYVPGLTDEDGLAFGISTMPCTRLRPLGRWLLR